MQPRQEHIASRLRRVQQALGVTADGLLGPETLTALETRLEIKASPRAVSLVCSRRSLEQILRFEVGSRKLYEQEFQHPVWPGALSGVTIGIGYDLGHTSREQITRDWEHWLSETELAALLAVQGVTGPAAQMLAQRVAHLEIPLDAAEEVFYLRTLPRFAANTRAAFPGVERLPPDAQGMMLSLVYNRGSSLEGERRTEMAEIARLLRARRPGLESIARQFESMKRLWPDSQGLRDRRQREADIIRSARKKLPTQDIVRL